MIFVRRDPALFPSEILRAAEAAQRELETKPESERIAFIKSKAHVWKAFAAHLSQMSYGKCWYSESPEPQSFFDVDHFRPKAEARRSESEKDDGYPWLAFSWDNFRISAQRSNRRSTDEDYGTVVGKGSWFPLLQGSPKATWLDRCVNQEKPILIDPTDAFDVKLLEVGDDGRMKPSRFCVGSGGDRVERSIELYGLNLPDLVSARKRVMREVSDLHEGLMMVLVAAQDAQMVADKLPVQLQVEQIKRATLPNSAYSRAARAQLYTLTGGPELCATPEECLEMA